LPIPYIRLGSECFIDPVVYAEIRGRSENIVIRTEPSASPPPRGPGRPRKVLTT
jgi:hypothetical protein